MSRLALVLLSMIVCFLSTANASAVRSRRRLESISNAPTTTPTDVPTIIEWWPEFTNEHPTAAPSRKTVQPSTQEPSFSPTPSPVVAPTNGKEDPIVTTTSTTDFLPSDRPPFNMMPMLAGIIVGAAWVGVPVVVLAFWAYHRSRRRHQAADVTTPPVNDPTTMTAQQDHQKDMTEDMTEV